jgi:glycosyltransferase involved in cell wall biosynthesis
MYKHKRVSVVIPTYNEAESIRGVINGFFATGFVDEVIAVDNNARGDTEAQIKMTRATYVKESQRQGYGHAIMRGLNESTGDLIVITEGDGTFLPKDIEKFLSYSDEFQVVLGTRTSRATIWTGAFMPFPVRFGNWLWAKVVEVLFDGPILSDVGCTYKLLRREALESIRDLFPRSNGSGTFSPELMIWLLRRGMKTVEIPVNFKERVGESTYTGSTWKAAKLGFKMLPVILRYRFMRL